jgi:hypothetical protein
MKAVQASHILCVTLLAWLFAVIVPNLTFARRAIPDDNLAYPVLVTVKTAKSTSFGSGFYLNTGEAVFLVTAKHVLAPGVVPDPQTQTIPDAQVELLSYSKDLPTPKRIVLTLNLPTLRVNGDIRLHQSQDLAAIRIGPVSTQGNDGTQTRQINFLPGVTVNEFAESGLLDVSMESVKMFDQVLVGNDAILYGYPVSLAIQQNPLFDPLRPLLRKALIAGEDQKQRSIIIDGSVYRGNSGGPVFEIEPDGFQTHFYLIGVLTDFVPLVERAEDFAIQLNSGYSVAKPMDFVVEITK